MEVGAVKLATMARIERRAGRARRTCAVCLSALALAIVGLGGCAVAAGAAAGAGAGYVAGHEAADDD
jgi:hypothetical protein